MRTSDTGSKIRVSILGDSISTFEGYTPSKGVFFDRYNQYETGLASVEDTWWMQVIRGLDGRLGYNDSLAGSTVTGMLSSSATAPGRIQNLGKNGIPDLILIATGCNDWAYGVNPKVFEQSYSLMLDRVRAAYPKAEIWCSTFPEGKLVDPEERFFFNMDSMISKRIYGNLITALAAGRDISVADLSAKGEYETIDGIHPNKAGMHTLAQMWLEELL